MCASRTHNPRSRLTGEGKEMISETPPSLSVIMFDWDSDQIIPAQPHVNSSHRNSTHVRPDHRPFVGTGGAWRVGRWREVEPS